MKNVKTILTATAVASAILCGSAMAHNILKTDPAKFTLTVINHTDQDMKWQQTWAKVGSDAGTIAAGATLPLPSNESNGDTITITPKNPPEKVGSPNPQNGMFQMNYGWDGHIAYVAKNNFQNHGSPTEALHYQGGNWIYATKWLKPSDIKGNATNTVTITTKPFPPAI